MFHPRHNKSLQGSPFAIRANAALPNPQSAGPLYEGLESPRLLCFEETRHDFSIA